MKKEEAYDIISSYHRKTFIRENRDFLINLCVISFLFLIFFIAILLFWVYGYKFNYSLNSQGLSV
jgi:hypothetical protein